MAIANFLQPPERITSGADITGGLDRLGRRLPVQAIGGNLLDGVTTVTPSVRYLAFRAWLIHRYGQSGRADSWQAFTDFAARVESALVLGNLIEDRSIGGLIGSNQALERLALGEARSKSHAPWQRTRRTRTGCFAPRRPTSSTAIHAEMLSMRG